MIDKNNRIVEIPAYLRNELPPLSRVIAGLSSNLVILDVQEVLFRAAYAADSVLPPQPKRTYRFGPPEQLICANGSFPFWWLYTARDSATAVWEAQFCKNDVTRPGTFYFNEYAVQHGVIAELRFPRPLKLWDLNGSASSRLGIFDALSSPDYEWCNWFGYLLDEAMQQVRPAARPDGFIYPSRRHRGHAAVALSSRILPTVRHSVKFGITAFMEHEAYKHLLADPLGVPAPAPTGLS